MKIAELQEIVQAPCPSKVLGIDSSGEIHFTDDATDKERAAVQALMDKNLPLLVVGT
jgi:hypothetical protein